MSDAASRPAPDERDLVARARAGDATALGALYERHRDAVHRAALGILADPDDAADVLQDVFVGLPEALRTFEGRGSLEGWLRKVAARTALMRLRRDGRRRQVPLDDAHAPTAPRPDEGLRAAAVRRAVDALPEALRIVFTLKEIEGYSHAEVAALLGIRVNTSEVRLLRARRRLYELLRGWG